MRLIDADELTKSILSQTIMNEKDAVIMDRYLYVIQNQPTAYDIDKVVEQIEFLQDNSFQNGIYNTYQNAIEIVKAGGENDKL